MVVSCCAVRARFVPYINDAPECNSQNDRVASETGVLTAHTGAPRADCLSVSLYSASLKSPHRSLSLPLLLISPPVACCCCTLLLLRWCWCFVVVGVVVGSWLCWLCVFLWLYLCGLRGWCWFGVRWLALAWCALVGVGLVWCGWRWCGVVWCGKGVWCGVVG